MKEKGFFPNGDLRFVFTMNENLPPCICVGEYARHFLYLLMTLFILNFNWSDHLDAISRPQ
jgi:hypothetical protein